MKEWGIETSGEYELMLGFSTFQTTRNMGKVTMVSKFNIKS